MQLFREQASFILQSAMISTCLQDYPDICLEEVGRLDKRMENSIEILGNIIDKYDLYPHSKVQNCHVTLKFLKCRQGTIFLYGQGKRKMIC